MRKVQLLGFVFAILSTVGGCSFGTGVQSGGAAPPGSTTIVAGNCQPGEMVKIEHGGAICAVQCGQSCHFTRSEPGDHAGASPDEIRDAGPTNR